MECVQRWTLALGFEDETKNSGMQNRSHQLRIVRTTLLVTDATTMTRQLNRKTRIFAFLFLCFARNKFIIELIAITEAEHWMSYVHHHNAP